VNPDRQSRPGHTQPPVAKRRPARALREFDAVLELLLATVARMLDARRVIFAREEREEPFVQLTVWEGGTLSSTREMAEAFSPVATELAGRAFFATGVGNTGFRNREIAEQLNVTEGTVKLHLHNVYQKLDIQSRVELTLYAQQRALV